MTDNIAVLDGFTVELFASSTAAEFPILVRPGTDLADRFKAWDMDSQEYVMLNGWLWSFEPDESPPAA